MVSFKITDILNTSEGVRNSVNIYGVIDPSVNVAGTEYLTSQFTDVMAQAIVNISNDKFSDIENRPINNPSNSLEALTGEGNLYKDAYVSLAKAVIAHDTQNGTLPPAGLCGFGYVPYQAITYAFARILAFYKSEKYLPNYVVIKKWAYKPPVTGSNNNNVPTGYEQYVQETANCQVSNPKIQSLAKSLKGNTPLETAKNIFYYVRDNLEYKFYENTAHGAVGTLDAGEGNCCDLSHLEVALLRACNIPARYKHVDDQFTNIRCGHVVAEAYISNWNNDMDASNNNNGWNQIGGTVKAIYGYYRELPF